MKKLSALSQGVALFALVTGISGVAHAAPVTGTAGGATIHNVATLSYGPIAAPSTVVASVDVVVQTVAAAPTLTVSPSAQTVVSYATASYTVTMTSNSNGNDTIQLSAVDTPTNTTASATTVFYNGATAVTSVDLAASVTVGTAGSNFVEIPAGSETGLAAGQTVLIGSGQYTVGTITPGTIATTVSGVTTAEVHTQVQLTPIGAAPAVSTIAAGTQLGQVLTLTEKVTVSAPSSSTTTAQDSVVATATTTATNFAGSTVSSTETTVTTVTTATVSLTKYVRNVGRASGNTAGTGGVSCGTASNTYYVSGVTAKSGDTLEYCLMANNAAGQPTLNNVSLKDPMPAYTTYVTSSTYMNGLAAGNQQADVAGASPLTTSSGLTVTGATSSSGQINAGDSATVFFKVTVQ